MARYTDFTKGVIDTGNLVYFLAATGVFLFLTVRCWNRGGGSDDAASDNLNI